MTKFNIGETVVVEKYGLCKYLGQRLMYSNPNKLYHKLDIGMECVVYIPIDSNIIVRRPITKKEIKKILLLIKKKIKYEKIELPLTPENYQKYYGIVEKRNLIEVIKLLKLLHINRKGLGTKLNFIIEKCKLVLIEELEYVLGRKDIRKVINDKLTKIKV